jgi:hypothetical protein
MINELKFYELDETYLGTDTEMEQDEEAFKYKIEYYDICYYSSMTAEESK